MFAISRFPAHTRLTLQAKKFTFPKQSLRKAITPHFGIKEIPTQRLPSACENHRILQLYSLDAALWGLLVTENQCSFVKISVC